jgi:hypothetical protein
MAGLDILLAKSLDSIIRENLGKKTLEKIEKRLFERYGINLTQSIEDFTKLDSVLREFFGEGADGLERQYFERMITIEQESKTLNQNWIIIEEPSLAQLILGALGDEDKRSILNAALDEPRIIPDILDITKIQQTIGYGKVNSLIDNGLLVVQGHAISPDGKSATKYKSIFEDISLDFEKNLVVIKVLLAKESIEKSSIIQVARCNR